MPLRRQSVVCVIAVGALLGTPGVPHASAAQLGTAFTYQGRLSDGGQPAEGTYDFRFQLFDALLAGNQIGADVLINDRSVDGGFFTVELNFGAGAFVGDARWLQIAVRPGASADAYTPLIPRQPLTAAPYAMYALAGGDGLWTANGDDIYKTNPGEVGIGTSTPSYPLHVVGNASNYAIYATGTASLYKAYDEDGPGLRVTRRTATTPFPINVWSEIDGGHIDAFSTLVDAAVQLNATSAGNVYLAEGGGDVGIGTTSPGRRLQIGSSSDPDSEGMIRLASRSGTQGSNRVWDIGVPETDGDSSGFGYSFVIDDTQSGSNPEFMVKFGSGNVGIGTSTPAAKLHVEGGTDSELPSGGFLVLGSVNGDNVSIDNNEIMARSNGAASTLYLNNNGGDVILAPQGTASVRVLQVTGADVAEKFPVSEQVEPGMLVALDPNHPGELCLARGAYNRRIAGVVSGANGLPAGAVLGHLPGNEDAPAIALSGRVWTFADASSAPIEVGDLLTTSDTPGHAMCATDPGRSHGTVLGKAMTPLAAGRKGLVLVLVNLQ